MFWCQIYCVFLEIFHFVHVPQAPLGQKHYATSSPTYMALFVILKLKVQTTAGF